MNTGNKLIISAEERTNNLVQQERPRAQYICLGLQEHFYQMCACKTDNKSIQTDFNMGHKAYVTYILLLIACFNNFIPLDKCFYYYFIAKKFKKEDIALRFSILLLLQIHLNNRLNLIGNQILMIVAVCSAIKNKCK